MKTLIILTTSIALHAAGICADPGGKGVTLRVSRDFGSPPLLEKRVPAKDRTVMDILRSCADVRTSLGGSFVTGINGVEAGGGRGWFYYVNGTLAPVGAAQYVPREGDNVWWDLHAWKGARQVSAVIGAFPLPFAASRGKGDAPLVLYADGMEKDAERVRKALVRAGARETSLSPIPEKSLDVTRPVILVGPWDALLRNKAVSGMAAHPEKCGFFTVIGPGGLSALGADGSPRQLFPRAGALFATRRGNSLGNPAWFVTGTDPAGVREAARVLAETPEKISGLAAAVVAGGKIYALPFTSPTPRPAVK